jgi:hypothetical protein
MFYEKLPGPDPFKLAFVQLTGYGSALRQKRIWIRIESNADPQQCSDSDPCDFWPPRSVSGSFHQKAKNQEILISAV